MPKFLPLLALLLGLTATAHADRRGTDELNHTVYRDGRVQYVMTYQEENTWKLQVFEAVGDQLQNLIVSEQQPDRAAAVARHQEYLKSIGYSVLDETGEADLAVGAILEDVQASADDSGDGLWPVTQAWNDDWEKKYSKWVADTVGVDFFQKYGISTDCADVVIGSSWIFAYMNGLPIGNTLSGSGRLVGQMTMKPEWRDLPRAANWYQNQQFLAALNYVMDSTYTKSLGRDSYPIFINTASLVPGTHHLEFHERGGHAALVKTVRVKPRVSASIQTLNSTLPRQVRRLILKEYSFGDQATPGTGFQRIRRVYKDGGQTWKQRSPERHTSFFSEEQYSDAFMNGFGLFSMAVSAHLSGNLDLNVAEWKKTLKAFEQLILQRVSDVQEGYRACRQFDCSADADLYETHSTPGRDDSLKKLIRGLVKTVQVHESAATEYNKTAAKTFNYMPQHSLTVGEVIRVFLNNLYDSDPRSEIPKRWGQ